MWMSGHTVFSSWAERLCPCPISMTPSTATYTLSLHDALPISGSGLARGSTLLVLAIALLLLWTIGATTAPPVMRAVVAGPTDGRSEEHTSELQSQSNLVCRLLLEKKNTLLSW